MDQKSKHEIPVSKDILLDLVKESGEEKWEAIDELLPKLEIDEGVVDWIFEDGLKDQDGDVRDLAVSILNVHDSVSLDDPQKDYLLKIMEEDTYHIVKYRSAIALFQRNIQDDYPSVQEKVTEALGDPDLGDLAQQVLGNRGE